MIKTDDPDTFDAGLNQLSAFGTENGARGRFIALYFGLRLMADRIAPLGSGLHTPSGDIQRFMDAMWTKTNRPEPWNVLTAPFGGGGSSGGYSTLTGIIAPGRTSPTNTWRNNLNSQKGIGCVAPAHEVEQLVARDDPRAACPHHVFDGEHYVCALSGAMYRGEQHSIWLRRDPAGFQVMDLDEPGAFEPYLRPGGARIPIFPLLAVLYCFARPEIYPPRREVTITEFEADFGLTPNFTQVTFDCDPLSPANAAVLAIAEAARFPVAAPSVQPGGSVVAEPAIPARLPTLPEQIALNSGLQAELLVASALQDAGWTVHYTGGQPLLGFDLRAESSSSTLYIEVKSSIGFVTPTLTESEWNAAKDLGEHYVLAVVDHVGTEKQSIFYVPNPAGCVEPVAKQIVSYRLPRAQWAGSVTDGVPVAPPQSSEPQANAF